VRYATDEAKNTVLGAIYQQFINAKNHTHGHEVVASQRSEDIAKRQLDINHTNAEIKRLTALREGLEAENTQADQEREAALAAAQAQRHIARGAVDTLALLGHSVPEEQLDFLRAANWERVEKLHDELDAANGVKPL
jgi:multidrug efflux pump subunit AcrA (membrane-fusion protein)